MTVRVLLFAVAREVAGREVLELPLDAGATVADLRAELACRLPGLAPILRHVRFAVDAEYAGDAVVVRDGAEVACIPPVSGG